MSVVALWRSYHESRYDRVYLIADSKYSNVAGAAVSPITPHGQKVFQIRMRAFMAPTPDKLMFASDLGLAFVGNVILGQMLASLASTVLGNLHGGSNAKPPSVEFLAYRLALLLKRILSVSSYKGKDQVIDSALVGNCLVSKSPQAWRFFSDEKGKTYTAPFDLTQSQPPISTVHFLGDRWEDMGKIMQERMAADKETDPELIPLGLVADVAQKGLFPTIGGELHGGVLTPRGFNYRAFGRLLKETKSHIFTQPSFLGLLLDEEIQTFGDTKFMAHDFEVRSWQD